MIRYGLLIPGSETPVGEGANAPVRAQAIIDGRVEQVVLKRLDLDGVLAEAFCAVLLRAWGLPVPEPALVRADDGLAFASLDAGYPNLKQRLGWRDDLPPQAKDAMARIGAAIVCTFADIGLAIAADEAIANADRNLGNILWDGADHAYIDHERALGRLPGDANLLVEMAHLAGCQDAISHSAVAATMILPRELPAGIGSLGGHDTMRYAGMVESRLRHLSSAVLNRFPKPSDLLEAL